MLRPHPFTPAVLLFRSCLFAKHSPSAFVSPMLLVLFAQRKKTSQSSPGQPKPEATPPAPVPVVLSGPWSCTDCFTDNGNVMTCECCGADRVFPYSCVLHYIQALSTHSHTYTHKRYENASNRGAAPSHTHTHTHTHRRSFYVPSPAACFVVEPWDFETARQLRKSSLSLVSELITVDDKDFRLIQSPDRHDQVCSQSRRHKCGCFCGMVQRGRFCP